MKMITLGKTAAIGVVVLTMTACSSWDGMSHRQKSTVAGAGIGGAAGAVITGGSVLGTVGGAAVGGIIGDQVGKNR